MTAITNIFRNTEHNRLRAGWRLSIQLIIFLLIVIGLALLTNALGTGPGRTTGYSLMYVMAGLGLAWAMARFIDHRSFADFGFHLDRAWWSDLCFGLALGAFLITGVFLSLRAAGWVAVDGIAVTDSGLPFVVAVLSKAIVYVAVGINEELTFRGYQLKNLSEGLAGKRIGPRGAIVLAFCISSAVFSLAHITNASATFLSVLNLVIGGVLLGLPYLLTGELAISIGLHVAWNFFEGTVYGFAVSGSLPTTHLLSLRQTGPELWTGGAFGPEAGLLSVGWTLIGIGLIVWWIKWHRKRLGLHTALATYSDVRRGNQGWNV